MRSSGRSSRAGQLARGIGAWLIGGSLLGIALVGPAVLIAPAAASAAASTPALPVCSATNPAAVTLGKDASTAFSILHQTDTFDEFIAMTYSGCRLSSPAPTVDVISGGVEGAKLTATFVDEGDGVAFIHVTAPSGTLADGSHTIHLIVRGAQVSTSVVPVSITHQYRNWLLAVLFAIGGWLVGLVIATAHGGSADGQDNPAARAMFTQLRTRWLAVVPTVGAAYVAYVAGYENNASLTSGLVSLLGIATKVGAASAGALVLTSTAGASARAITSALRKPATVAAQA
jgi:hypothetical protein